MLSNKEQCKCCTECGRVKGLEGWCCISVQPDGFIDADKPSRKSNCWCLDQKPYGWLPKAKHFHTVGRYLTERYGTGVKLSYDVSEEDSDESVEIRQKFVLANKNNSTDFKVSVESKKLKLPIDIVFSMDREKGRYGFDDVKTILKNHEI